ncbi:probable methyltransferase At1g29790 [Telopea speciosissima]|uniref:probable methyltransferase At1g29790 n=1 Tax=Telopea speciosissima TaxID=54955 RepID=UPI001CC46B96|nr:probable methyltransferase At1g29790 [Telopea speciosissima]
MKLELDLTIAQLMNIANTSTSVLSLAFDIQVGTRTSAARMKLHNITVLSTTMNLGATDSKVTALWGLVPLHVPLQQHLPVFDGFVDLVRCGHAVKRCIPITTMEFLFYDVDRVLRPGGYFWLNHFFIKEVDLERLYLPLILKGFICH